MKFVSANFISGKLRNGVTSSMFWCCQRNLASVSGGIAPVLGIETSCDDTAVCILTKDRRVLSSRRFSDRKVQLRLGGTCPSVVAEQHRTLLDTFVAECLREGGLRLSDLGGIAVSTRPGLVIALKVGIASAVSLASVLVAVEDGESFAGLADVLLCRKGRLPLACVHHMHAHATAGALCNSSVVFPFLTILISGGHSIIALARGPDNFEILSQSVSGSCGECLDKIVREIAMERGIMKEGHPGALLEDLATRCGANGHLRYRVPMPGATGTNFNFDNLKASYLTLLRKELQKSDFNECDFCASVQHSVAGYLASKLHHCLEHLLDSGKIVADGCNVVVAGGVASNAYILRMLTKVALFYGVSLVAPSPHLCSDNAEMVAWNGILLLMNKRPSVFLPDELPVSVYAEARCPVGPDVSDTFPSHPRRKLSIQHLADEKLVFRGKPISAAGS